MHIAFDVDGVLCDLNSHFVQRIRDRFDLDVPSGEARTWGWVDWIDGMTIEMERQIWNEFRDTPRVWQSLPAYAEARKQRGRINRLGRTNALSFITNRFNTSGPADALEQTALWLRDFGIDHWPNVYVTDQPKGLTAQYLGVHIMLEDKGENVTDLLKHNILGVMLRRPYNEAWVELVKAQGGRVVNTVEEFIDLCMQVEVAQEEVLQVGEPPRDWTIGNPASEHGGDLGRGRGGDGEGEGGGDPQDGGVAGDAEQAAATAAAASAEPGDPA